VGVDILGVWGVCVWEVVVVFVGSVLLVPRSELW
jgi:hypothetical protein